MERNLSIRQPLHRRFRHVKVLRTEFYVLTIPDARHAYLQISLTVLVRYRSLAYI